MNPEIKQKWVAALRSGEFTQIKGWLRSPVDFQSDKLGHCCLGVLCEVYHKETGKGVWNATSSFQCEESRGSEVLPDDVRSWAGLRYCDPVVETEIPGMYGNSFTLAHLNDSAKFDFNKIADIIETKL